MEKKTSIKNVNLFIISNTKQDLENEIIEKISKNHLEIEE